MKLLRSPTSTFADFAARCWTGILPLFLTSYLAVIVGVIMADDARAVTSGPGQPEFRSFTPPGTDYVDLFTGGFQYSIPLFELPGPNGGYPFTLGYRSGSSLEEEDARFGLGWNLTAGMITRQVRGLPDDLRGTVKVPDASRQPDGHMLGVHTEIQMLPSNTYGFRAGANYELIGGDFGAVGVNLEETLYYNTRRGFGLKKSVGVSGQVSGQWGMGASVGVRADSEGGVSATASLSAGHSVGANATIGYNNISGLQTLELGTRYKEFAGGWTKDFAKTASIPDSGFSATGFDVQVTIKGGPAVQGSYINFLGGGFLNAETISSCYAGVKAYGYLYMDEATADDLVDFNREKDGPIYTRTPNLGNPVLTPDLYVVSGAGLGGTFRAYRADIPVIFDKKQISTRDGATLQLEVGGGAYAHGGGDGTVTVGSTTISRWDGDSNQMVQTLDSVNPVLRARGTARTSTSSSSGR